MGSLLSPPDGIPQMSYRHIGTPTNRSFRGVKANQRRAAKARSRKRHKALLITIMLTATLSVSAQNPDYCDGFNDGYKDGFCYADPWCIPPLVPMCPWREFVEPATYKAGYQRGFLEGKSLKIPR